jgi:hypothetical protein
VYEAILVGISKACFAELSAKLFDEGTSDRQIVEAPAIN